METKNTTVPIAYVGHAGLRTLYLPTYVAPPKGDRWGPGIRIPTLIVSPFAKHGTVDHTLYDTGSILRLITKRFDLPVLDGLKLRDDAMEKAGSGRMGDLSPALDLPAK